MSGCEGAAQVEVTDVFVLLIKQCEDKSLVTWLKDDVGDPTPLTG